MPSGGEGQTVYQGCRAMTDTLLVLKAMLESYLCFMETFIALTVKSLPSLIEACFRCPSHHYHHHYHPPPPL